jgi:hypothetical protein
MAVSLKIIRVDCHTQNMAILVDEMSLATTFTNLETEKKPSKMGSDHNLLTICQSVMEKENEAKK